MRLAALKEAPYAFGSNYPREVNAPEAVWRKGLQARARYIAEVDGEIAGTISVAESSHHLAADLTAMWVAPQFRRQGAGNLLMTTAVEWARAKRLDRILLWVTDVNSGARRFYERNGFVATGATQDVRPGELEHEMSKSL